MPAGGRSPAGAITSLRASGECEGSKLKAASAPGLTIPQAVLVVADEANQWRASHCYPVSMSRQLPRRPKGW